MKDSCSSAMVAQARAVTAVGFGHSLATCPVLLQNRQRLLSMWHWHSCGVSLLSFPSFLVKSRLDFRFSRALPLGTASSF